MPPSQTMTAPHATLEEFLTPAIAKELDKSMETLMETETDDFFLDDEAEIDAVDGPTHQPSHLAASAPAVPTTRPLIESSAEATAYAAIKNAHNPPPPKSSPTQTHPTWNAVHMELQNNAKLPTFNLPVNRSNSLSGLQIPAPRGRRRPVRMRRNNDSVASSLNSSVGDTTPIAPEYTSSPIPKLRHNNLDPALKLDNETSQAIDEILRLNDHDLNLSEMFFDEDRSSARQAYSFPKEYDVPKIDSKGLPEEGSGSGKMKVIAPRPDTKLFYRAKPLPIPVLRGSPAKPAGEEAAKTATCTSSNQSMAQAIATAAAIATSSGEKGGTLDKSTAAALSVQPTGTGGSTSHQVAPASAHQSTNAPVSVHPTITGQARPMATIPSRPAAAQSHPSATTSKPVVYTAPHPVATAPVHPLKATHPSTAKVHSVTTAPAHHPAQPHTVAAHHPANHVRPPTATRHPIQHHPAATAPHQGAHPPGHPPASHPAAPASARPAPVSSIPARTHPYHAANPPPQSATPVSSSAPGRPHPAVKQPPHVPGTAPYHPGSTYHHAAKPPISHAAAHATTKASLAYASAQRSSYGYGVDHRVVGVPAPAPNVRGYRQQPPGAPYAPIYATTPAGKPAAVRTPVKSKSTPEKEKKTTAVDTDDPAYERKKERAKDARVRLNKAIEELAVAMDLAGTQSKERLNHLTQLTSTLPSSDPNVANNNVLSKMMGDTAAQADSAKKWDRPSFVGLSATIIHSLNAQCEGLMREVMHLRREKELWRNDAARSFSRDAGNVSPDASSMHRGSFQTCNTEGLEPLSKRQKLGDGAEISGKTIVCNNTTAEEQRRQIIQEVSGSPKVLSLVAAYLDPTTLCRCLCVSQQWISFNIFQNQQTWLSLCYKRFGSWSVRKWEGDEDEEEEATATHASPSMDLYCRMVEKNVKPYCSLDGSVFLGGSSLDGIVSGWVTLVERSNGETSRSVMLTQSSADGKSHSYYSPIPVVELRVLVQNTSSSNGSIYIPDQQFSVDASTRRKGEKMLEVTSDDRFKRRIIYVEKAQQQKGNTLQRKDSMGNEMCRLNMFEYAVLSVHIHARGCSTTSKFCHRAKKVQILVSIKGTTRPLVIPISGQR